MWVTGGCSRGFTTPITSLTLWKCKLSPCHIKNAQAGAFPSEMIDSLGSYLFIFHAVRGTFHQGLSPSLDDSASVLARAEFPKHRAMEKCPLERGSVEHPSGSVSDAQYL